MFRVFSGQNNCDRLTLNVTLPVNTTATVLVPAKSADPITESGQPLAKAPRREVPAHGRRPRGFNPLRLLPSVSLQNIGRANRGRCKSAGNYRHHATAPSSSSTNPSSRNR